MSNRFTKIEINEKAFLKLKNYKKFAEDEIGGLLDIRFLKNTIRIRDVILLEQNATGGSFSLDDKDLAKYTERLFSDNPEQLKNLKGWWHKHPINGWSGWDDSTFESLRKCFGNIILGLALTPSGFLFRLEIGKKQWIQFNTPYFSIVRSRRKVNKRALKNKCKSQVRRMVKPGIVTAPGLQTWVFDAGSNSFQPQTNTSNKNLEDDKIDEELIKQFFDCPHAIHCRNCVYYNICKNLYIERHPLMNQDREAYYDGSYRTGYDYD